MPDSASETSRLLHLFRFGDDQARDDLIAHACERLRILTRRMLKGFPGVRRWEQTDDVLQNALLRLCRALEATKPESVRHFYNLAALQIRRELIDLAQHHMGPEAHGAKHHTDGWRTAEGGGRTLQRQASDDGEPDSLENWTEFHERVEGLPDQEREAFNLVWYKGLSQGDAASVLGISLRTMKRRWQSARLKLAESMDKSKPR